MEKRRDIAVFVFFISLLVGLQGSLSKLWGQVKAESSVPVTEEPQGKEQFQASQWLRLAREFHDVKDYPMSDYYGRLIRQHYPNTSYSKEAKRFLKKGSDPGRSHPRK